MRNALLLGLTLIALHTPGQAQDVRWYQIEALFFRNLSPAAQFEEQWPTSVGLTLPATSYEMPAPGAGAPGRLTPYQGNGLQAPAGTDSGPAPALDYVPVAAGGGELAGALGALNRSGSFRVIDYRIWRQALKADARPLYLHIAAGDHAGDDVELEGYIGFSLKRYLHIESDLWWVDLGHPAAADDTPTAAGPMRVAHLRENRRMRSAETHYLDHPLIGMLIRITPADGPGD